jgi:cytosine/adenosine deaminase-related metal-dependent hydrolase
VTASPRLPPMPPLIYAASLLYTGDGAPVRDGWIRVEEGRIKAVGNAADLPKDVPPAAIRREEGAVLMPGLVNLHCHLELTGLHGKLGAGQRFPEWVGQLRAASSPFTTEDYRAAAREGVRRLVAGGCTTVLDVGNTGEALGVLADSPLRAFACVELLGLDPALAEARFRAAEERLAPHTERGAHAGKDAEDARDNDDMGDVGDGGKARRFHPGVAPHAAYSMSPALLRRTIDHQRARGLPVTIHAAESREEAELFATGTGPLADYCRMIFPGAPRLRGTTPVRWLESEGLLPDGLILVHGNTLDAEDMDILARRGATVVHCPSSHAFFGHPRFPYEELRARGINVALGTDSLASGDSLSMLAQMRLFAEGHPDVPEDEIVALATINGARALGLRDVGLLRPGWKAEFVARRSGSDEILPLRGDGAL